MLRIFKTGDQTRQALLSCHATAQGLAKRCSKTGSEGSPKKKDHLQGWSFFFGLHVARENRWRMRNMLGAYFYKPGGFSVRLDAQG
jgi:hypothetical protein